ncbi:DUF2969 family protein [Vagococcus elongatus]|nr:DUF2969 family protein [Vagococcus elongatus]
MSKNKNTNKNTEIEVKEFEINKEGKLIPCYELKVGKKIIGTLEETEPKKISVIMDGETAMVVKTVEEGIEAVIRQWNLFQ